MMTSVSEDQRSMFSCRQVTAQDFEMISTFPRSEQELFFISPKLRFPLTAGQLEEIAKERRCPTVLTCARHVSGYANFYNVEKDKCWLGNFIISPEYRGKGAAEFLIKHMMGQAGEELKVQELHLICHNINTRALLFYTRMGFKPYEISNRTTHQGSTIAGIHMRITV
ncbi:GNAT family N-acetyltransferase [Paenibacillus jiagnxiensis]|uniref:GNAT family N-acetyltransferase n=1 Tax=Paenibacillus jiagnxiensis TaxID=3228926 RepID=UPI0033A03423